MFCLPNTQAPLFKSPQNRADKEDFSHIPWKRILTFCAPIHSDLTTIETFTSVMKHRKREMSVWSCFMSLGSHKMKIHLQKSGLSSSTFVLALCLDRLKVEKWNLFSFTFSFLYPRCLFSFSFSLGCNNRFLHSTNMISREHTHREKRAGLTRVAGEPFPRPA